MTLNQLQMISGNSSVDGLDSTLDYDSGDDKYDAGFIWFKKHEKSIIFGGDFYELIMASFCAVSNCYFLAVICFVKQIRDWKYFPIAFQSMCDLLSCGFVLFWKSMQDVIVRHGKSDGDYFLSGRFATWYRSTWLGDDPPVLKCVQEFILDIANDYSTAPCLLIMAAERKHYPWKVMVILLIFAASIPTFVTNYDPRDCDKSYYSDFVTRYIFDGFILFAIPAAICICLYTLVGIRLWTVRQNANRNKNLTVAFLVTTFLWVILWFPRFSVIVYEGLFDDDPEIVKYFEGQAHYGHSVPYYILQALTRPIKYSYSLLNPIIIMFTVRSFQKPILYAINVILCRENPADVMRPTMSKFTTNQG